MYGEELKGIIEEYLRDSKAEYAVMIDGDWGSGKTYFLTHSLTGIIKKVDKENDEQRRYAYVSLYGVKSTSEVSKEIMFQYLGNKKSNKFKAASNILSASLGAFNVDFTKVEEILQMNISNWIICFDDLERCCFSINEMLGYINQLVEHNKCKVIVLANEKEIGKITLNSILESKYQVVLSGRKYELEKKDCKKTDTPNEEIDIKKLKKETENLFNEDILYGSIKEKVIGLKINYEPQMGEVYDSIISDFGNLHDFNEYIKKNKSRILDYFKDENCNNLRTLISVLKCIRKVHEEMIKNSYNNTDPYFERIMDEFVKYIALFTIYYKKGGNIKDLRLTTEIGYVPLGQSIYSRTRAFKFLEKYCVSLNFSKDEFSRTVASLRKEYEEEEKRKKKARLGMAEAYEKLSAWWEKEDKEVDELIGLLRREIGEDKYSYESYQGIIGRLIQMESYGHNVGNMDEIIEMMNENISKSDESIAIERRSFSFTQGEKWQQKYDNYVSKLKLKVDNKNQSIKSNELLQCLDENDWSEKLLKYCDEHYNDFLFRHSFIDLLDLDKLYEKMENATVKELWSIRGMFDVVYHISNINEFFANDLEKIKDFRNRVDETSFDGINRRLAKQVLVEYLDDVISRL